ncbi:MAG: bifunctional nuclease family protein [Chloroflexi bacterium]|nr:bifunctional nuclease family protein [Chloroflexota bacterium]MQC16755.1 bifunctional nuclease family protein [Chloroflexota bacterium]MQC47884.1 bifunctional nuclease family protein [Chloroflexota bacterium]
MRELVIDSIRLGLRHYRRVVVLKERDADRYITIWIGSDAADSIALKLQDVSVPRPQSHDLMLTLVHDLGGTLKQVTVNDLRDDTFFATLHVEVDGREIEVDSRPSDAIALAVRAGAPIYVSEEVLDRAGIVLDEDDEPEATDAEEPRPPTAEELERLSVFRDFVAGLDLDDLGKDER